MKDIARTLATALTHGWDHVAEIVDEKARRLGIEDAQKPQVVYLERGTSSSYRKTSYQRGKKGGAE